MELFQFLPGKCSQNICSLQSRKKIQHAPWHQTGRVLILLCWVRCCSCVTLEKGLALLSLSALICVRGQQCLLAQEGMPLEVKQAGDRGEEAGDWLCLGKEPRLCPIRHAWNKGQGHPLPEILPGPQCYACLLLSAPREGPGAEPAALWPGALGTLGGTPKPGLEGDDLGGSSHNSGSFQSHTHFQTLLYARHGPSPISP